MTRGESHAVAALHAALWPSLALLSVAKLHCPAKNTFGWKTTQSSQVLVCYIAAAMVVDVVACLGPDSAASQDHPRSAFRRQSALLYWPVWKQAIARQSDDIELDCRECAVPNHL